MSCGKQPSERMRILVEIPENDATLRTAWTLDLLGVGSIFVREECLLILLLIKG